MARKSIQFRIDLIKSKYDGQDIKRKRNSMVKTAIQTDWIIKNGDRKFGGQRRWVDVWLLSINKPKKK